MAERSEPDYNRPPAQSVLILTAISWSISFLLPSSHHPPMLSFLLRLDEAMIRFVTATGELQPSRLVASEHVDRAD